MSLNAATIEILITKGLSAADLLEVARAMEVKRDPTNADRQARHRARRRNAVTVTDAPPNDIDNSNPCSSEPEGSKETKRVSKKSLVVQAPEWVPAEPWLAFVAMRKAMKGGAFTADAAKLLISRLDTLRGEGHCPEKLLNKAVLNGWKTVYPGDDTKATKAEVARTVEWLEGQAKFFAGINDEDQAQKYRAEAAKARGRGPPKQLADLTGEILRRAG